MSLWGGEWRGIRSRDWRDWNSVLSVCEYHPFRINFFFPYPPSTLLPCFLQSYRSGLDGQWTEAFDAPISAKKLGEGTRGSNVVTAMTAYSYLLEEINIYKVQRRSKKGSLEKRGRLGRFRRICCNDNGLVSVVKKPSTELYPQNMRLATKRVIMTL